MNRVGSVVKRGVKSLFVVLSVLVVALSIIGPTSAQGNEVLVVEIEGPVTPTMASFFDRAIEAAEQSGVNALVIVLDTPGGDVSVMLEIVQSFRNANVPIIVFVGPAGAQAASAGSVITVAAHAAAMAPETVIGAASPVDGSGADISETLFKKITEDLKATMRNLTERRGEEAVTLAEAMIEDAKAVTSKEALEAGLIDVVAADVPDLLQQLDGLNIVVDEREIALETAGASQQSFSMNVIEQLLHALSNPLLIGILLTIGVQAILIEISSPGGWVAGFIGVICLGMALYGLGTLPSNWLGLALILVAFVLLILEVKTPSIGALAVVGSLTLLAGLLVLFNSPGTPEFARIPVPAAIAISLVTASFFVFIVTKAVRAQLTQPVTGSEAMLGQFGPAKNDFQATTAGGDRYSGTIMVKGELWRATSDEEITRGEDVVVTSVDGFTLHVERTDHPQ